LEELFQKQESGRSGKVSQELAAVDKKITDAVRQVPKNLNNPPPVTPTEEDKNLDTQKMKQFFQNLLIVAGGDQGGQKAQPKSRSKKGGGGKGSKKGSSKKGHSKQS